MSAYKKSITVWLLGFLTVLAVINIFNSVLMWQYFEDATLLFRPFIIDQFIGYLQIDHYFWMSVAASFILLGFTAFAAYRGDINLIKFMRQQSGVLDKIIQAFRVNLKSHEHLEAHIDTAKSELSTNIDNFRGELSGSVMQQEVIVRNMDANIDILKKKLGNDLRKEIKSELKSAMSKQEEVVKKMKSLSSSLKKAKVDLADIKKGLLTLETALVLPKPKISFESSPAELKGVGPQITKELEAIGINDVGAFLITDPSVIGEYTHLTPEKASHLQGTVQLLMIPDIDDIDIELLEKVGVTNRKELAAQDPFELNIKMLETVKSSEGDKLLLKYEKPSLEEVLTWVRIAKF